MPDSSIGESLEGCEAYLPLLVPLGREELTLKPFARIRFGDDLESGGGFRLLGMEGGGVSDSFLIWLEGRATLPAGVSLEEGQVRVIGVEGGVFVVMRYEPLPGARHGSLVVSAELYRGDILAWASEGRARQELLTELAGYSPENRLPLLGWMLAGSQEHPPVLPTGLPFRKALALLAAPLLRTQTAALDVASTAQLGAEGGPKVVLRPEAVQVPGADLPPPPAIKAANALSDLLSSPEQMVRVLTRAEDYLKEVPGADYLKVLALAALLEGVEWWARVPEAWLKGFRFGAGFTSEHLRRLRQGHTQRSVLRALGDDPAMLCKEIAQLAKQSRDGVSFAPDFRRQLLGLLGQASESATTDFSAVSRALLELGMVPFWIGEESREMMKVWWRSEPILDWAFGQPRAAQAILDSAEDIGYPLPDLAAECTAGWLREGKRAWISERRTRFHQSARPAEFFFAVADSLVLRGLMEEADSWNNVMKRNRDLISPGEWLRAFPRDRKGPIPQQWVNSLNAHVKRIHPEWLSDAAFAHSLAKTVQGLPQEVQGKVLAQVLREWGRGDDRAGALGVLLGAVAREETAHAGLLSGLASCRGIAWLEPERVWQGRIRVALLAAATFFLLFGGLYFFAPSWIGLGSQGSGESTKSKVKSAESEKESGEKQSVKTGAEERAGGGSTKSGGPEAPAGVFSDGIPTGEQKNLVTSSPPDGDDHSGEGARGPNEDRSGDQG